MLTLFIVYYGIQMLLQSAGSYIGISGPIEINAFVAGMVALSVVFSSYASEVLLSAFRAIPKGQFEASQALGLGYRHMMVDVILPQAVRIVIPPLTNNSINVMKDTALVSWLGIIELLRSSQIIVTRIQEPLFVLTVAGLIYFLISFPISRFGARLERKWREND